MHDAASDIGLLRRHIEELEDRVAELEGALGMSHPVPAGFRTQDKRPLSRKGAWRLICGLAKRSALTREQALILIYADRHVDERPSLHMVDATMCHARRWLLGHGVTVDTDWGSGWSLTRPMRDRTRALIEQIQAEAA